MTGITVSRAVQAESSVAALTPREREVVDQMAEGCTNAEIAERLHVSARTIENCVSVIYQKLPPPPAGVRRVQVVLLVLLAASGGK